MIKKNFLSILIFFFAISCSTDITIAKINKPSYKLQKKNIKGIKILNEHFFQDDSKTVKKILEEEKYFFERKIENRNRIFDSLNLIKKDKIVIIDSKKDNNGNRIESSYFFYDNTVVYSFFLIEDSIINREVFRRYIPKTEEILNIYLKKNLNSEFNIYNAFSNSNHKTPILLGEGNDRTSYFLTLVYNNEISYYSIYNDGKYKIVKH